MYRFRFESVLRYRKQLEDQKKKEFAFIQNHLLVELSKLRVLEEARDATIDLLYQSQKKGMSIRELSLFDAYLDRASYDIDQQRETLLQLNRQADIKRQELLEASQRKSILAKLRDHEREAYLDEERRQEKLQNDEISLIKFTRTLMYAKNIEADTQETLQQKENA